MTTIDLLSIEALYLICLVVGVAYALLATVLGWLFGHGDGDVHVDAAGHLDAGHLSPVSGTVIATFVTGFGAGGTIAHHALGWTLVPGMLAAVATGLALAAAVFAVMEAIFSRTQAGSEYATDTLEGLKAEVITSIGAGRTGEITFVVKGQRERASARASDGAAIAKGTAVVIESMTGSTALVRRADDASPRSEP